MKITSITTQIRTKDRYSIFVDGKYAFSLSEGALLDSKITKDQELDEGGLKRLKQLSDDDKIYNRALQLVAARPKTKWEVGFYLQRKGASPALSESILNKLINIGLIDDNRYAHDYVRNRELLRPTSRRKMRAELLKKRLPEEAIEEALKDMEGQEGAALDEVIRRKRRQSKYQDDEKLMQYLARQGFSYQDIKSALRKDQDY